MSKGSAAAFAELFVEFEEEVRRVLTHRCGCKDVAADILQEAYRRLIASNSWQQAVNPRALLYRVVGNLATDLERRRKVESKYFDEEPADEETAAWNVTPEQVVEGRERLQLLLNAVQNLPPQCRRVFILRKFEDLEHAEIAQRLGISRNMVEKHLRNALLILRKSLD